MEPLTEHTELRDWPWVELRLACHFCRRGGSYRVADIAGKHGSRITVGRIVIAFICTCAYSPWNPARKPQKYGAKCGAYCPDIGRTSPPDWPPPMQGLTLIEGGKDELRPAEPSKEPARRRVGGSDQS
jgi:hypothetical protein